MSSFGLKKQMFFPKRYQGRFLSSSQHLFTPYDKKAGRFRLTILLFPLKNSRIIGLHVRRWFSLNSACINGKTAFLARWLEIVKNDIN